jgi:hypothetical protein
MELSKLMKLEVKIVHIRIYEEMGMIVVPLQDLVELEQKTMDLNLLKNGIVVQVFQRGITRCL